MIIVKVPAINGLSKTKGCEKAPNEIMENNQIKEISVDNSNIKLTNKKIYEESLKIFKSHEKAVFLGGDHSISFPILKAFLENYRDVGLIVFDAHPDCMPAMKEPTHEEWISALVREDFPAQNIILIGLRNIDDVEQEFLNKNKINYFSVKEIFENIKQATDTITEMARKFSNLYVKYNTIFAYSRSNICLSTRISAPDLSAG